MRATPAGEKRTTLMKEAKQLEREARVIESCIHIPDASRQAQKLREKAEELKKIANDLKTQALLENLSVWEQRQVTTDGDRTYTYHYWVASWRQSGKTRNVHLGNSKKISKEEAMQKARAIKAEALGMNQAKEPEEA